MTGDQDRLLDDLLQLESGLTAWEMDFLDNLDQRFRERDLSEKQAAVLHRIAGKVGLES